MDTPSTVILSLTPGSGTSVRPAPTPDPGSGRVSDQRQLSPDQRQLSLQRIQSNLNSLFSFISRHQISVELIILHIHGHFVPIHSGPLQFRSSYNLVQKQCVQRSACFRLPPDLAHLSEFVAMKGLLFWLARNETSCDSRASIRRFDGLIFRAEFCSTFC